MAITLETLRLVAVASAHQLLERHRADLGWPLSDPSCRPRSPRLHRPDQPRSPRAPGNVKRHLPARDAVPRPTYGRPRAVGAATARRRGVRSLDLFGRRRRELAEGAGVRCRGALPPGASPLTDVQLRQDARRLSDVVAE